MPGPQPPPIELNDPERRALETLVRGHGTPQQLAQRARSILAAADGANNTQIARLVGLDVDTVRLWRTRWLAFQGVALADLSVVDRLSDAPRSGRPARITAEQVCQIVALACVAPQETGRPISQWSGQDLADEAVSRGIVARLSPRHAARLLQRGTSNPTAFATG